MKEKVQAPELRFDGFTDDWEERKLGTIYDFGKGKGLPLDSFIYSSNNPAIAYGHLYTKYSEVISEVFWSSNDNGVLSKDNDLLFPGSSTVPNGTAQANAITLNNVKLGGDIIIGRPKEGVGVLSTFMSYQVNSQRQKLFPITVGTTITHMYGKDISKLNFFITDYSEQEKIASFFKQLDDTIALHQRKLDLLKEQKKGYLQKMFPKNGAKVPELRFAGFADDWEDCKLEEVLRERNNQQSQSLENPLVSFTVEKGVTPKTDRYEREQLVVGDKSSKKYKVTVLNDIVYNPANLKFGAISRNKYGNAVFSPIYITFVVNNDVTTPEFIEMFVTRNDFIKRALKYQQGTVYERQSVSPADLLSMVLYLPGKAEQEKIGSFFKQLDDTIDLHQRKLDLLKEQKKGFLQKMFV